MLPCVFFALHREAKPFLQRFPQRRVRSAPCVAYRCSADDRAFLVLETGVGVQRSTDVFAWLVATHTPTFVLSAGFAGALQPDLPVGAVVIPSEVATLNGEILPLAPLPGHNGRLLTANAMIGDPHEKRRLGKEFAAWAVDMESAALARLCREASVPFACVRVISDEVQTELSAKLLGLLNGERASLFRITAALLGSPRLALELGRLAQQTRRAAQNLAPAVHHLLDQCLSQVPSSISGIVQP